jgi:hypothetical protein
MASRHTIVLSFLAVTCFYQIGDAIEIEQVLWGFDGKVNLHQFNPVSILISNPSDRPVDLTLRLRSFGSSGVDPVDAPLQESLFLAPFSSRWVQFYPYVITVGNPWQLSWGRLPGQHYDLTSPGVGPPATVRLTAENDLGPTTTSAKAFPEQIFPPMAAATGPLAKVILDHVPRWQAPQRQALLDWIHLGGELLLLAGSDGSYPTFTDELRSLNMEVDQQQLGAGCVRRAKPEIDLPQVTLEQSLADRREPAAMLQNPDSWVSAQPILKTLRNMTHPKHNWTVIHLLSVAYLVLIFPGAILLARNLVEYRIVMVLLIAVAVVFAMAFQFVGQRGYGESTSANSVAIAKSVGEGTWSVEQWTNVFVTSGDAYTVSHQGTGQLYSTAQETEGVNGLIDNGLEGTFLVDIPLFSSRSFVHRHRMEMPGWRLTLGSVQVNEDLTDLELVTTGEFPTQTLGIFAMYRKKLYYLVYEDNKLRKQGEAQHVSSLVHAYEDPWFSKHSSRWSSSRPQDRGPDPGVVFTAHRNPLMARDLGITGEDRLRICELPSDRVRVFVYAPMPSEYQIEGTQFGKQEGCVLYCVDVPLP